MDPLTQGITGAIFAQTSANKESLKAATLAGLIGGMAPDLDVFVRSTEDTLLAIEYHRHFTHSLAFIPFGGLIVASILWLLPYFRKKLGFKFLYLYSTMGYATAGLLDACTSYGTQLFWPFSNARVAWNNIGIIDPLFTFILLVFLLFTLFKGKPKLARIGFSLGIGYLCLGEFQNRRAEIIVNEIAISRGHHSPVRITAKPSPLTLLLWRGMYEYEGEYYVDGIHLNYGPGHRIYPGQSIDKIDWVSDFPSITKSSTTYTDFIRFNHFSDGYIYEIPGKANSLADLRYSLLPNSIKPLWGIEYDPENPNKHAIFKNYRSVDKETWNIFKAMLFGKDIQ